MKKLLIFFAVLLPSMALEAQTHTLCVKKFCAPDSIVNNVGLAGEAGDSILRTNMEGCWDLDDFPAEAVFRPFREDKPLNGVSTYDLVLISKHILGIEPFTEPWQWIAADANRNNEITTHDIVELRKLVLQIYDELPENTSWRFVPTNYVFPAEGNPLSDSIPDSITKTELSKGSAGIGFWAIKIGDLNCSSEGDANTVTTSVTTVKENLLLTLLPNPTSEGAFILLELQRPETARVQVHDISGRLVYDVETALQQGAQSLEIPQTAMPQAGIYFWNVQIGEQRTSGKLVKI